MGRRQRLTPRNRFENGARSSIGDRDVDTACAALNKACLAEAAIFTQHLTSDDVTPMVLKDDVVAKLKAVHGLLASEDRDHYYDLQPWANGTLTIYSDDRPSAAGCAFEWHGDRAGPLLSVVQEINSLHIKWGAVKHLLRWFNRNATPGAVRANWPSVLVLCPDSAMLKELQHAPTRYTNPQDLSALLPLIRATATTVAAMKMLPADAVPRVKHSVSLGLPARTVTYEGVDIDLDSQSFWL